IGETYTFRASYFIRFSPFGNPLIGRSLATNLYLFLDAIIEPGTDLSEEIMFLDRNHRAVTLQATEDMTALPIANAVDASGFRPDHLMLPSGDPPWSFRLNVGRALNRHDHENANPVAVISQRFSFIRGVRLGDTITVEIPRRQEVYGYNHELREMLVRELPDEHEPYLVDLEVVGIYVHHFRSNWGFRDTSCTGFIYVPASILPGDLELTVTVPGTTPGMAPETDGDYPFTSAEDEKYLPIIWYSFVLTDSRPEAEQRFLEHYRPLVEEAGLNLILLESGSHAFWQLTDSIILTLTFNAAVFWLVLILTSAFVAFLYISQRRRDMAIQQALGFSKKRIVSHILVTAICFISPGVIIGGYLGWVYSISTAEETLGGLSSIIEGYIPAVEPAPMLAAYLGLAVLALMLGMILVAILYIMSFPVLAQLQGRLKRKRYFSSSAEVKGYFSSSAKVKEKSKTSGAVSTLNEGEDSVAGRAVLAPLPAFSLTPVPSERTKSNLRWIQRQIARSGVKTALCLLIAMLLVLSLGWLRETISRTEVEIDDMWDLAVIYGELKAFSPFGAREDRPLGDVIGRRTIDAVRDSGYAENFYIEGAHYRNFIIAPAPDGSFPDNWGDIIGYDRSLPFTAPENRGKLDMLFAVNNLDIFIENNALNNMGTLRDFRIDFAEGFDTENFQFSDEDIKNSVPVPVILSSSIMEKRGLSLGDEAFLGFTMQSMHFFEGIPIIVIGTHSGQPVREAAEHAILIPISKFDHLMLGLAFYTTFTFTIDTAYNREIEQIRDLFTEGDFFINLAEVELFMSTHELLTMVRIASQSLALLQLIYPIAVATAILIALGMSFLLLLQTAKSAAILRVTGMSKVRAISILIAEPVLVSLSGAALGVIALAALSAAFGTQFALVLSMYLTAVLVGATTGAFIVCNRMPISMLQVKE
ncbi:MAG: ABC transporter permease, partial [Oscillospiraceae bacterium]|nr:ABC transporter permease [Oscillospiraceae bacterium]